VKLSSSEASQFWEAEYTARGGYRQAASEYGARDLSECEKTLGTTFSRTPSSAAPCTSRTRTMTAPVRATGNSS